ncbi:MAG: Secretion system C-terminal sorting domain, partial [Bacteroidota bacterium]
ENNANYTTQSEHISINSGKVVAFPNPTNNIVLIKIENGTKTESVDIYDSMGRLIKKVRVHDTLIYVDLSDFRSGLYFLKIDSSLIKIMKN